MATDLNNYIETLSLETLYELVDKWEKFKEDQARSDWWADSYLQKFQMKFSKIKVHHI